MRLPLKEVHVVVVLVVFVRGIGEVDFTIGRNHKTVQEFHPAGLGDDYVNLLGMKVDLAYPHFDVYKGELVSGMHYLEDPSCSFSNLAPLIVRCNSNDSTIHQPNINVPLLIYFQIFWVLQLGMPQYFGMRKRILTR